MPCIYLRLIKVLLNVQLLRKKEIQRKTTNLFAYLIILRTETILIVYKYIIMLLCYSNFIYCINLELS